MIVPNSAKVGYCRNTLNLAPQHLVLRGFFLGGDVDIVDGGRRAVCSEGQARRLSYVFGDCSDVVSEAAKW